MSVWAWRLFFLLIVTLLLVSAYDHWTKPPSTLFEQVWEQSLVPRQKLEDSIPSFLERGYPCDDILQTIVEVRWFMRNLLREDHPSERVRQVVAMRRAQEKGKRATEAEKYPNVYHGGLTWLRLKKSLFGSSQKDPQPCS